MEIKEIYLKSQSHKIISIDKNRGVLSHAYMLECADEFLLEEYSKLIVREIFCLSDNTPCDECVNCLKVEHGNMVDLKVYPKDKSIMVEDIVEIVSDCIQRPMDGTYKVYILKNFDKANVQAQNKILKTLEEPPLNVIFLLTCSNSSLVLPTIKSRVKSILENLLDIETVSKYLSDLKVKDPINVASVSGGNIFSALKLASGDAGKIISLALDTLINLRSSADILKFSSQILALKKDFPFFVDTLISILRDASVLGYGDVNFKGKDKELQVILMQLSLRGIEDLIAKLCEIYNKLEFNCNMTGVVEQMLLDILEVKFLCQK